MKSTAFAPGHISGFFEPVYNQDLSRTGSRGAGINISLGAVSEVFAENSTTQNFEIYVINIDGTGKLNLSQSPGDDVRPV